MIDLLLLFLALAAPAQKPDKPPYEPPPATFYPQAAACSATTLIVTPKEPSPDEAADLLTWGLVVADMGRKSGRTKEQVEADVKAAETYFRHVKEKKPPAFAAHRDYCRALFVADRP